MGGEHTASVVRIELQFMPEFSIVRFPYVVPGTP